MSAKCAKYKDVLELQGKAPGLYMRLLTRVQSPGTWASVTDQTPTPLACLCELRTPQLVCMWSPTEELLLGHSRQGPAHISMV